MQKSTVRRLLCVVAACLLVIVGYMLLNRTTSREATAWELAAHAPYAVDWTAVPGWEEGMTEKAFLLNLCSYQEEKTIGNNVHTVYSSDILETYLYRCHDLSEITVMGDTLYITYYAEDQDMIILAYTDEGLHEKAVWDSGDDTLFHEIDGVVTVWNKFRKGFQWGSQ